MGAGSGGAGAAEEGRNTRSSGGKSAWAHYVHVHLGSFGTRCRITSSLAAFQSHLT